MITPIIYFKTLWLFSILRNSYLIIKFIKTISSVFFVRSCKPFDLSAFREVGD